MPKQTLRDLDLDGRKVLIRVDFNVPQGSDGSISDDRRIVSALPTIQYALDQNASVILISHLGRPKGDPTSDAKFRMDLVAQRLQERLDKPVVKADDTVGESAQAAVAALQPGGVVMLENVRFNPGEKKGDLTFAKALSSLGDAYVNDAFGTCHRDEASMLAVPEQFAPENRAIGFLVEKELTILDQLLGQPKAPMIALMGGSKVSDKILVIENLLKKVDQLLVGGAMTYTFLKAQGHEIGNSRCEEDRLDEARRLLELAGGKIILPLDHLIATSPEADSTTQVVEGPNIPEGWFGMDIGPATASAYSEHVKSAGTVVWNGPMGKFEDEPFSLGTRAIAEAMGASDATTAVGGGETAEAVQQFGFADQVSHVSTGGGAFLESLEGKQFNSLAAIPDR